ncbi:unnamed protein product [Rotaria sp. Silwood2]|nr:unnamed protein product [Rotaria sp. Silwood2]CAF2958980.1 unnamed protein product [Rotaria sp. Silwood2]CAF3218760.1 unnamed protein product [Rotaria sp. Silwood2]CAF3354060.1 unnamed protein product [Rotaria sp. Silwood2]CAF3977925.1 unnamed protein product [Rotaria sp. Silwood2]
MDDDLDFKFLALGDSGVGKTCLLSRYVDGKYIETLGPTVGIDIRNKTFEDTAGQERFRSLTSAFFREAVGFLLVFDLTNEASFINARNWITEIQTHAYSEDVDMILIGNKSDLDDERVISKIRARDFAKEYNIQYIETSALKNINVDESIKLLLDSVMARFERDKNLSKTRQHSLKPVQHTNTTLNETMTTKIFDNNLKDRSNISRCCS